MFSRHATSLVLLGFFLSLPFVGAQAAVGQDTVVKGSSPTLYYYASDGYRYVFPNEKVYYSWFQDFSVVKTISDQELSLIPLRGNITYRPGVRLVKLQTDPKTYAVDEGGVLRWVESEQAAIALYGQDWNRNIDDLPDTFFADYESGAAISSAVDFAPEYVAGRVLTINRSLGLLETASTLKSNSSVGRYYERAASDMLPDLIPLAPYDLSFDTVNGRTVLRFTATFWNSGDAPLELTAEAEGGGDQEVDTYQKIWQKDGSVRRADVGHFLWHDVHDHYHYANFADYALYPATTLDRKAVDPTVTQKTTFCMRDDLGIDTALPGAPRAKVYSVCGRNRQGVSVGWADRYPSTLPDQYIDVHDVEPGLYRLSFVVDPQHRFVEKSLANNVSAAILKLNPAARTLRLIASGAAYPTLANQFPDGVLLRSEEDFVFYVTQGNAKRLLRTSDTIASYGYNTAEALVLPAGVLAAIPDTKLVRLSGTSGVYMLNEAGYRRKILTPEVLASYGLTGQAVVDINATEFAAYLETDLVRLEGSDRVYSIASRQFVSTLSGLASLGYDPASVHAVNRTDFASLSVEVVASGLSVPWDIVFLPGGDMLVTERPGTLRRIGGQNAVIDIPTVRHVGEGGLMGLALHPDFTQNNFVYLYFTSDDGGQSNRIVRFRLQGTQLIEDRIILDNIPSALYHDGGQIAFGPDGMLYVTTGDASSPDLSQNLGSLGGKTLRLLPDGGIPSDNPFGTAVWSYGHRNAQGIAWDPQGRMWQTEHGRSGALSGYDELNLIEKGKNYGWPTIQGSEQRDGLIAPRLHSGSDYTWAPAGIAYSDGRLFFAGLRGSELYAVSVNERGELGQLQKYFSGVYGRLRAVVVAPDGSLYVSTSNRDGRGTPREADDKILHIYPDFLGQ